MSRTHPSILPWLVVSTLPSSTRWLLLLVLTGCGSAASSTARLQPVRPDSRVLAPTAAADSAPSATADPIAQGATTVAEPSSMEAFSRWLQTTRGVRLMRTERWGFGAFAVVVIDTSNGPVACVLSRGADEPRTSREFCVNAPEADETAEIQPVTNRDDVRLEDLAARVGRLMIRFSDGTVQVLRRAEVTDRARFIPRAPVPGVSIFPGITDVAIIVARNPGLIQLSTTRDPDPLQNAHVCARVDASWLCAEQTPAPRFETGFVPRATRALQLTAPTRVVIEYESSDRNAGVTASHTSEAYAVVYEPSATGLRAISRLPTGWTMMRTTAVDDGHGASHRATVGAGWRYPIAAEGSCLRISPTPGEARSEGNFRWYRSTEIEIGDELPADAWGDLVAAHALREPLANNGEGAEEEALSTPPSPIRPALVGLWTVGGDGSFHRVPSAAACVD
ncbi:MAG: hypothetical protein IPK60_16085 [Sandaracinaceae bacterium]|nr:hypothetical protein [Sandaracinaceae bacterium]